MPISFPQSPTLNQQVIAGGKTWVWDGERWMPRLGNVLVTVGNTVPSTTNFGSFWLDSDTGDLSMYLDGAWVGVTEYAGGGGAANLLAVTTSIVPTSNVSLDLGTPTLRWRDLYLSGNTLVLGDNQISSSAGNLVLPANTVIGNTPLTSLVSDVAASVVANTPTVSDIPRIANIQILNSSFTVLDDTAVDTATGGNIFINGSGYVSVPQVYINQTLASSVAFVSSSRLRVSVPAFPAGTYPVYVINPDGATATFVPGLSFSGFPDWSTAAGSLTTGYETRPISLSLGATSNSTVQYILLSGSLPPGATLNGNTGVISGTYAVTNSPTTYNFTVEARDQENQGTTRAFSITVSPDIVTWSTPTEAATINANQGDTINQPLVATTASGYAVTYSATGLPTGITVSGNALVGSLTTFTSNASLVSTLTATSVTTNRTANRTLNWSVVGIIYTATPSTVSITEGQSVTYTITTINLAVGTTLYWTNSGTAVASDFSGAANSGSFTISGTYNAGTASVTLTTTNEAAYEGSETIIFQVRAGSTSGAVVATAATVTLIDAAPTYSVSPSTASVNEGSAVTWTVTTTNVANGTTLYWTNSGTAVAADFTGGANSGSFTINSNTGSIVLTMSSDATTEGSETAIIQIRTGSTSGTVVATASTVTISDTSLGPPSVTYFIVGGGGGSLGGGGGVLSGSGTIASGVTYDIVVGAGSTNYGPGRGGDSYIRSQSDSSYLGGTVAYGGGNGGYAPYPPTYVAGQTEGSNGGSGGGAGANNIIGGTPGGAGVYPGSSFVSATRQGYDGVGSYYYIYGAGGGAANSSRGSSIQGIYGSHYGGNGVNVPGGYVSDSVVYASGAPSNERGVNSGAGGGDSGIVILRSERPHVAISGTYTITNQSGGWTQYKFTGAGTIRF